MIPVSYKDVYFGWSSHMEGGHGILYRESFAATATALLQSYIRSVSVEPKCQYASAGVQGRVIEQP